MKVLDQTLAAFVEKGPTQEEVERAQRYLRGVRRVTGQTAMSRCQELALDVVYGLGIGRSEAFDKALSGVTPEGVQALARSLLASGQVRTTLLGPKPKEEPKPVPVSQLHH